MKKYAIKLTKDDNVTILGVCNTKAEATELGNELRKQHSKDEGLLACIEADFDESNRMIGNSYKLLEIFR